MNQSLLNNIPVFEEPLPEKILFDLDLEGPFEYFSPIAIDKENHTIKMNFVNMTDYSSFIKIRAFRNNTFKLVVENLLVTNENLGEHVV